MLEMDSMTLKTIINFWYSAKIKITTDNVQNLLKAARQYSLTDIEKFCFVFSEAKRIE